MGLFYICLPKFYLKIMVNSPGAGFISIKDPDDTRLAAYSSLKGKKLESEGLFIAEGEKVVKSMLDSACQIASCLTAKSAVMRYKNLIAMIAKRGASVYVVPDGLIERLIGFRFHRGIMAVGYCPEKLATSGMPGNPERPLLFVALNAVNDPQNVGLIARNAAAFGASALIVDSATYDPYYRKAVRVSMGTIFRLPVYYEDDLKTALLRLRKKYGLRIITATPGNGARDITKTKLAGNICFVFGNEDKGVSRNILKLADLKVRIPIRKDVDSLNVASASAVCLYEASRHRPDIGRY